MDQVRKFPFLVKLSISFSLTFERPAITINITWNNHGVAPIYEAWNVNLALVSNGSVVAQGTSKVDLRTVMPESPVSIVDQFDIAGVEKGEYSVQLQIVDPTNHNMPLALAIKGASSSMEYTFGSFMVDPSIAPTSTSRPSSPVTSNASHSNVVVFFMSLITMMSLLVL